MQLLNVTSIINQGFELITAIFACDKSRNKGSSEC